MSPFFYDFALLSRPFLQISEKVHKSLITRLPAGRQGLNIDYTDGQNLLFDLIHFRHFSSPKFILDISAGKWSLFNLILL